MENILLLQNSSRILDPLVLWYWLKCVGFPLFTIIYSYTFIKNKRKEIKRILITKDYIFIILKGAIFSVLLTIVIMVDITCVHTFRKGLSDSDIVGTVLFIVLPLIVSLSILATIILIFYLFPDKE